jgi:hypothetical protein
MNIRCKWSIKRQKLTPIHIDRRLKWAEKMSQDHRMFLPWVFTDESSIEINPSRCRVYPIPGLTPDERIFQDYEKFPMKIMVWSAISRDIKWPLYLINGNMDQNIYLQILRDADLVHTMDEIYGPFQWVLQDDGAHAHRAKSVKEALNQICLTVSLGDYVWPANSPDLNPIEELWHPLKYGLNTEECTTREQLFENAQSIWNNIPIESINNAVDQFPTLIQGIIALAGHSLNGQQSILREIKQKTRTPEEISFSLQRERADLETFSHESREFFMNFSQNWDRDFNYPNEVRRSEEILSQLPRKTLEAAQIYWDRFFCGYYEEATP